MLSDNTAPQRNPRAGRTYAQLPRFQRVTARGQGKELLPCLLHRGFPAGRKKLPDDTLQFLYLVQRFRRLQSRMPASYDGIGRCSRRD